MRARRLQVRLGRYSGTRRPMRGRQVWPRPSSRCRRASLGVCSDFPGRLRVQPERPFVGQLIGRRSSNLPPLDAAGLSASQWVVERDGGVGLRRLDRRRLRRRQHLASLDTFAACPPAALGRSRCRTRTALHCFSSLGSNGHDVGFLASNLPAVFQELRTFTGSSLVTICTWIQTTSIKLSFPPPSRYLGAPVMTT